MEGREEAEAGDREDSVDEIYTIHHELVGPPWPDVCFIESLQRGLRIVSAILAINLLFRFYLLNCQAVVMEKWATRQQSHTTARLRPMRAGQVELAVPPLTK